MLTITRLNRSIGSRLSYSALIFASWALLGLVLLTGCVPQSIHPIYDPGTLVFDEALLGAWENAAGEEVLEMEAHLAQIGEHRFMDLHIDRMPAELNELAAVFLQPVHTILRVDRVDDRLELSLLRDAWARRYLDEHPETIAHTVAEDRLLISAPTADLQRFYVDLTGVADAWEEAVDMDRIEDVGSGPR